MSRTSSHYLLALESDRWQVVRAIGEDVAIRDVPFDPQTGPIAAVGQVRSTLGEWDYGGQPVCLGLSSDRVFAVPVSHEGLPRRQRRPAMVYRLEEQLPLDAEGMTVGFLSGEGDVSLGLAVETASVRSVLDALAEAEVQVTTVRALSLLALWQVRQEWAGSEYCIIAWPSHQDLFRLNRRRPRGWYCGDIGSSRALTECLGADQLIRPTESDSPRLYTMGELGTQQQIVLKERFGLDAVEGEATSPIVLAAKASRCSDSAGWVEFRREGLALPNPWSRYRRLFTSATVLASVLVAALIGGLHWRRLRYEAIAETQRHRQTVLYSRLYPSGRVPPNVKARLRSEATRLSGLSGADAHEAPPTPNALQSLAGICSGLPPAIRLRITELRVGPSEVFVEGQARTHTHAQIVARGLGSQGFIVEPPRTEHLASGGVSFVIMGEPARRTSPTGRGGSGK